MAQSRIKMLDRLERIEEVGGGNASINIKFEVAQQPGKVIEQIRIKEKSYGALKILENSEAQIVRGDKIALIGANGKGKSTLLRMINGTETFDGKLEDGHNVNKSFYAQHQLESLNLDNNIITELQIFAPSEKEGTLRGLLGSFLFAGDDIMKKIKVLSGGEKARVALAKMILSKANFLILDEPTNHLDMQSVNILIKVLRDFEGSLILVSHDRYFVAQLANKIWWIENHHVKEYPGTYAEYEESKQAEKLKLSAAASTQKQKDKKEKVQQKVVKEQSDESKKMKGKLTKKFQQAEERIAEMKKKKEELERQMALPEIFQNQKIFSEKLNEFNQLEQQMKVAVTDWEKIFNELEKAEAAD
jgi:ATP-binding cassette subfamily F protein 3